MYRDTDRRPPITPQLALRVAIIGGVALVLFGIVFFRLWYLQVLSGDRYLAEANNNRVREINVEAPRGKIVDRNGRLLVGNRTGYAIQVSPDKFPKDALDQQRRQVDRAAEDLHVGDAGDLQDHGQQDQQAGADERAGRERHGPLPALPGGGVTLRGCVVSTCT